MELNTSEEDKIKLLEGLKEISASMTRMSAERDLINTTKKTLCDELQLPAKVLTKLAKIYHSGTFTEEVEQHKHFEELYEALVN